MVCKGVSTNPLCILQMGPLRNREEKEKEREKEKEVAGDDHWYCR